MNRIANFVLFIVCLYIIAFLGSLLIFPEWLEQTGWGMKLTIAIIACGLGVIIEESFLGGLQAFLDGLDLSERFIYLFGKKYNCLEAQLLQFSKQEIEKEKIIRKYIPNIFIENAEIKEKIRYFCDPFLFFSKIVDKAELQLHNDYIIKLLDDIQYPLEKYTNWFLPQKIKKITKLFTEINKYKLAIKQKENLLEIFLDEGAGIKPELKKLIPKTEAYKYDYLYPKLRNTYGYENTISEIKENLDLLQATVLVVKSKAGHGKTNLLCDFAENYLLKKNKTVIYINTRQLNYITENETIENEISRLIFNSENCSFNDIKMYINLRKDQFLYILIDGINEHKNLPLFSQKIEQFIQRCSGNIKILLTCRSEYFKERFGNLLSLQNLKEIDIDELLPSQKSTSVHKEYLITQYFNHFNIALNLSQLSDSVINGFDHDKLLLRFYCEAFEGKPQPGFIHDLYRLEIFNEFYENKIVPFNLNECLDELVNFMMEHQQFTDIPINSFSCEMNEIIENFAHENIVIRKDINIATDVAFSDEHYINFVYDEFRDYLIASKIIVQWYSNKDISPQLIEDLTKPECSISEGVSKYLCLWAIKNGYDEFKDFLINFSLVRRHFVHSIFSSADVYISDYERNFIKQSFKNGYLSLSIFLLLSRRNDTEKHPNLSIELLFDILTSLTEEEYSGFLNDILNKTRKIRRESIREIPVITLISIEICAVFKTTNNNEIKLGNLIKLLSYICRIRNNEKDRDRYYHHSDFHEFEYAEYPASSALIFLTENFNRDILILNMREVRAIIQNEIIQQGIDYIFEICEVI